MQSLPIQHAENIATTSPFNLTDRLSIFSYLVTSNRVRWYRVVMRIFFQRHRDLYRYQLTAQEVRETFDPPAPTMENARTEEQRVQDVRNQVDALVSWFDREKTPIRSAAMPWPRWTR